jgi:hypothetical protein
MIIRGAAAPLTCEDQLSEAAVLEHDRTEHPILPWVVRPAQRWLMPRSALNDALCTASGHPVVRPMSGAGGAKYVPKGRPHNSQPGVAGRVWTGDTSGLCRSRRLRWAQ